MSKHTPGPWVHNRESDGRDWFIRPAKGDEDFAGADHVNPQLYVPLATVRIQGSDFHDANARLIAAAPEMLAALEAAELELVEYLETLPKPHDCEKTLSTIRGLIKRVKDGAL